MPPSPSPRSIFLYLVLAAALATGGYYLYTTLMARFYPQTTRRRPARALRPVVVPADQKSKVYPDVKPYEEEWIPEGLKQRKTARAGRGAGDRSAGETGASSAGEGASSAGEAKKGGKARKGRK